MKWVFVELEKDIPKKDVDALAVDLKDLCVVVEQFALVNNFI
jgi:hypothetical protein